MSVILPTVLSISAIAALELFLRQKEAKKQTHQKNVTNYPYYSILEAHKTKRHPYYVNYLGTRRTPKIPGFALGLRDDITQTDPKRTILCLGCSFTEGGAHTKDKTYSGYLEKTINQKKTHSKYHTINAGIGGYGLFQIDHLFQKLKTFTPKVTILQVLDDRRVPFSSQKIKTAKNKFNQSAKLKQISHILWYLFKLIPKQTGISLREPYFAKNLNEEECWDFNQKYLESIQNTAKEIGTKLIILNWGAKPFFSKKITQFTTKHKIPLVETNKLLQFYKPEELILDGDAHPNALANKLVAKLVYEKLIEEKLI